MNRRGIITLIVILAAVGLVWFVVNGYPALRVRQAGMIWTGTSGPMRGVFDKPSGTLWVIHQNRNDEWNQRVVTRLDTKTMRVKRRYRFDYDVDDLRYLESENVLYLICSRDQLLVSIDADSGAETGRCELGAIPTCLTVSEDGRWLFVCTGSVTRRELEYWQYSHGDDAWLLKLDRRMLTRDSFVRIDSPALNIQALPGGSKLLVTYGSAFDKLVPPEEDGTQLMIYEDSWYEHEVLSGDNFAEALAFETGEPQTATADGSFVIGGGNAYFDRPAALVDLDTGETTEIPLQAEKYVATNDVAISKKLNKGFLLLQQRCESGESEGRAADILVLNLDDMSTYVHETPIYERFFQLFLDEANDQLILLRNQRQGLPLVEAGMVTVSPIS